MPSPGVRRSSWVNGSGSSRVESGPWSRRRGSGCSCPAGGALGWVALRSLLAVDLWLSRRLGLCAGEESLLGVIRPLVQLLELSAHTVPWISTVLYLLLTYRTAEEQELSINLLMALLLDGVLVGLVRTVVGYGGSDSCPAHPGHSFPSGLTTRAAMCARFLQARLLLEPPVRALLLVWAVLMGLSQVLLGQHSVSGVLLALALGYSQYSLVEQFWLPVDRLQDIMLTVLGDSLVPHKH